jgi:hypothetical protein
MDLDFGLGSYSFADGMAPAGLSMLLDAVRLRLFLRDRGDVSLLP